MRRNYRDLFDIHSEVCDMVKKIKSTINTMITVFKDKKLVTNKYNNKNKLHMFIFGF